MNTDSIIPFFIVMVAIFAVTAFIPGIYAIFKSHQLSSYLKKNKYARWREFSPRDNFMALKYIKSEVDNEDEYILRLKVTLKRSMNAVALFILSAFVTGALIFILALTR